MWDVIVTILLFNAKWWIHFDYVAIAGFPFTFLVFYLFWIYHLFPYSMYDTNSFSVTHICLLIIFTDFLQTICHYSAHTFLKHTIIGKSHMIHHTNRNPTPQDAFFTGFIDAVVQLIFPMLFVLCAVQPSKWTAATFGCIYSWWLLFIHSDPHTVYPWLTYFRFVTPEDHHKHHQNPTLNFSNIFQK